MKITQRELNMGVSKNVMTRYTNEVKGNKNESEIVKYLKVKRNFLLGNFLDITDVGDIKNYGNLILESDDINNMITRLYNKRFLCEWMTKDYRESQKDKQFVENLLGLDSIREFGEYIEKYKISPRCYKQFIKENGFAKYRSLLELCVWLINNQCRVITGKEKTMYVTDDWEITVTCRDNNIKEITNIIGGI